MSEDFKNFLIEQIENMNSKLTNPNNYGDLNSLDIPQLKSIYTSIQTLYHTQLLITEPSKYENDRELNFNFSSGKGFQNTNHIYIYTKNGVFNITGPYVIEFFEGNEYIHLMCDQDRPYNAYIKLWKINDPIKKDGTPDALKIIFDPKDKYHCSFTDMKFIEQFNIPISSYHAPNTRYHGYKLELKLITHYNDHYLHFDLRNIPEWSI